MNHLKEIGQITALCSFVIGTVLLAFFLYFGEHDFPIGFGILFIIVAFIINIIILTVLIGFAILNPKHRLETFKICVIMLINIPVVIFYIYLITLI